MNQAVPLVDLAPFARLALLALIVALLPLSWVWLRQRGADSRRRLAALTTLTLFLTFDLIVFGSFTRLTDSGLGCPDWPGCYGEASPVGAHADIHAAQTAMPSGPVTFTKAWIEMIHRYVAMTVGVLILVMAAFAWRQRLKARGTLPFSPWWPTLTLAWVVVQGLFGKYTVTLKLYPAIVTLHLLGGLALLTLLAFQHEAFAGRPITIAPKLRRAALAVAALLVLQIALGGWVSTNYAVLACSGFPTCNGQWWPPMEFAQGFSVLRHLGQTGSGELLMLPSLVGIHMVHRIVAVLAATALLVLAWRLRRAGDAAAARFGLGLGGMTLLQVATGLSNVELNWPIVAALMHSAGAAALVLLMALLLARSQAATLTPRRAAAP
ncbi:MAG: COX15/CtaA family protein [Burkholderiales bacterium]|nr:COX15/CtaA family protein [Burkholderiales bacterium]